MSEIFEKLVRELDPVERKELLDKLTTVDTVVSGPLIKTEPEEAVDLEKEYYSLGLLSRIVLFFKVVFSGEDKFELTENLILKKIDHEMRRTSGEIVSYKNGRLLEPFLDEFEKLHKAVKFFEVPVSRLWRQNRDEFLTYLGSFQIPVIHRQLMHAIDFDKVEKATGLANPSEIRKEVFLNVETHLSKITGELRNSMYISSKTLFVLNELINFDYESIKQLFGKKNDEKPSCYFGEARASLEKLFDILSAFKVPPDKLLLEAMYLFVNDEIRADDEEYLQKELNNFLKGAAKNLKSIKRFYQKVQPDKLMKLVTGNIGYHSKPVSGGEDWYSLYSRYWSNLADARYKKFSSEKKKEKIYKDMQTYFKKSEMPSLENYVYGFRYSCGFLNVFIRDELAAGMNEVLKKVLVDGRFYKKQNKEDFTDSYSILIGLYEKLKHFDAKFTKGGEYRMQIEDIEREMISESIRLKRAASIIEQADLEALDLLKKGLEGLLLLKKVLYGILHGKAGGQYDSLSNLNKLVTIESRDFIIDLNDVYSKIDDAYRILGDIVELEEAR